MTDVSTRSGQVRQTLAHVAAAELRRGLRARGLRVALAVSILVGVASGLAAWSFVGYFSKAEDGGDALPDVLPIEVGVAMFALALSIGVMSSTTRETTDGTVTTSLILVPQRIRLLLARSVTPTVLGAMASLTVALVLGAARVTARGFDPETLRRVAVTTAVSVATAAVVMLVVFLGATILRRGAIAVAVFMTVLVVLPLVAGILQAVGPAQLSWLAEVMFAVLPGTLMAKAMSVPVSDADSWTTVVTGLGGLLVWCAALAPVAYARFSREGTGTG